MRQMMVAVALTVVMGSAVPAAADTVLAERGRAIAEAKCAFCHAVGTSGGSPHKIVIPFRELSTRFPVEMLLETLKTGVVAGHDEMPMFDLGKSDAQALIAYIDSLAPVGSRYLAEPQRP